MQQVPVLILDHVQINHKIKRIAYQIYESNVDAGQIILAGIAKNGYELAKKLEQELIEECIAQIVEANGLPDAATISVGQELIVPQ